jgi:DNA-binding response OmpR family regulator
MYSLSKKGVRIFILNIPGSGSEELQFNLEFEGYEVFSCRPDEYSAVSASDPSPGIVLIDQDSPQSEGFAIISEVRDLNPDTAVIMLSDSCMETDKLRAFRHGADDYVVKPLRIMELMARIDALARRIKVAEPDVVRMGSVEINLQKRTINKNQTELSLTPLEFELLKALILKKGEVATREELLHSVWGHKVKVSTRTVDTHIFELRKKLEIPGRKPGMILTVPKVGYRLQLETG